jgi:starvation-inducible DNA-binding protein
MSTRLSDNLKVILSSTTVFAIKIKGFHWNVEGSNFPQYHKFFDKIYTEVYDSTDQCAELVRQLDSYTPGSLARFAELSIIQDQTKIPRSELMIAELFDDNEKLIAYLKESFHVAEEEDEQGIADFIATRIDAHGKWRWMLRSILKKDRE